MHEQFAGFTPEIRALLESLVAFEAAGRIPAASLFFPLPYTALALVARRRV